MKRSIPNLLLALFLSGSALADEFKERAKEIASLYNKGLAEMKAGDIDKARTSFNKVLELEPGNGHAKYQLTRLGAVGKEFQLNQRKAKFVSTKLPVIDFHDATLAEVVEALNLMSAKATGNEWSPNLIIQDPKGQFSGKEVTLQMKNVPVAAVLKYATEMTDASIHYDEYATVIRPR